MAEQEMLTVTEADYSAAENAVSAANIVSHDGYYEVDTDKAAQAFARHRLATVAATIARLEAGQAVMGVEWLSTRTLDRYEGRIRDLEAATKAADDRVRVLEEALVEASIPLEAMILCGQPSMVSDEMWAGIINGVQHARAALAEAGGRGG